MSDLTIQESEHPFLFPIMLGIDRRKAYIPWAMLAPHESWADRNHGQTLKRLAERGGLNWCETLAVLENRRYHRDDAAEAKVLRLWRAWEEARSEYSGAKVKE